MLNNLMCLFVYVFICLFNYLIIIINFQLYMINLDLKKYLKYKI